MKKVEKTNQESESTNASQRGSNSPKIKAKKGEKKTETVKLPDNTPLISPQELNKKIGDIEKTLGEMSANDMKRDAEQEEIRKTEKSRFIYKSFIDLIKMGLQVYRTFNDGESNTGQE